MVFVSRTTLRLRSNRTRFSRPLELGRARLDLQTALAFSRLHLYDDLVENHHDVLVLVVGQADARARHASADEIDPAGRSDHAVLFGKDRTVCLHRHAVVAGQFDVSLERNDGFLLPDLTLLPAMVKTRPPPRSVTTVTPSSRFDPSA